MLARAIGIGLLAWAPIAEADSSEAMRDADSFSIGFSLLDAGGGGDKPTEKPDKKPDGEGEGGGGEGGGGSGGGAEDSLALTGVLQLNGGSETYDGGTLTSTNSDENVILVQSNACLTISNYTLNKSGGTSSEDNSNFFALNAVVASKTGGTNYLDNCVLNSNAEGANCLFASGVGSTIYAYNCTLTSTEDSSRGLDATYNGTVIASKMTIDTKGAHCASLATDRGNGSISVTDSTLATAGQGSPLVYSTGIIEANGVTGTATSAQIAGIEGLSTIRIRNSSLSGSGTKASEPVANGVIIYQSNSGDSTEGTATFEASESTLKSAINGGALFYITNTKADIRIQNAVLDFDSSSNLLVNAAGNDGDHGWGNAGSNGAEVVFTALDQTLTGNIAVDGISSLDLYLTNSTYTGTFEKDSTNAGDGDVNVFVSADSTWRVTANCTLQRLMVAEGATIVDDDGNTVSIVNTNGTAHASGSGALTITVTSYVQGDVVITNAITAFEIDRSAFNEMYGISQEQEGGGGSGSESGSGYESGGGVQDHNNWTNYFKPHPPANAIVKVKVAGATEYGTPDRDHKYCLDGYWDEENGVEVRLLYVTEGGYLFADGCTSNVWDVTITNNAQEVYPPDDVVAIKAQAKSGSTDYLTLKAAVNAAKSRARIALYDDITLEEPLTVTNSITLNLNACVITLGSTLTNAFNFTASSATVSNGTIVSSLAATVEDNGLLRFMDGKATLSDLTITGNSCLLYVDGAQVTLTNNCTFTCDSTVLYCTANGKVTIAGGTYLAPTVLQAEEYKVFTKANDVVIAAPDGYLWNESGKLVEGTLPDPITPGVQGEQYDDALAATNAAARINANKADSITVPTGVEGAAKLTYLTKVTATATDDNRVALALTPAAAVEVQSAIDGAVTNGTVLATLVSTNASEKATIATTTPGLYYWVEGGTDVNAVTNAGTGVLSTNGGSIELTKPALDATTNKAFFRVAAGLSAPSPSNDEL